MKVMKKVVVADLKEGDVITHPGKDLDPEEKDYEGHWIVHTVIRVFEEIGMLILVSYELNRSGNRTKFIIDRSVVEMFKNVEVDYLGHMKRTEKWEWTEGGE